eukprot:Nitzschia sp. Nitz4//scaffold231_size31564//4129//5672//NITZ4_007938-RA/size31564-augustus-gene-0.26-mRNA-1//-1//CDS//3329543287//1157//frame0
METMDAFEPEKPKLAREKDFIQNRGDLEEWDSSRDGSHPSTPMTRTGKRKTSDDRQPESPPEIERQHAPSHWSRERQYRSHHDMDTDSPASYPKHVMVPSSERGYHHHNSYHEDSPSKESVSTPVLTHEHSLMHANSYEHPSYRPSNYYHGQESGHYGSPPRHSRGGHYLPEMDGPPMHYGHHNQMNEGSRPRRWACDYCNVASFVSYEEACAHEEACSRQYHERYGGRPHPSRGPVPQYESRGGGGMYHPNQEVGPPPPMHGRPMWGSRGPPMPHLPHDQQYHPHYPPPPSHSSYHQPMPPHGYQTPPRYPGYANYNGGREGQPRQQDYLYSQKRMLLAMPSDSDSLSDRQCYVRSEMVEIFAATDKDVSARHSKGAQKLVEGQVGIRCVHCSHLRPRDRAERAVCYPSSISRIYQTVADMQRFHFEQCREIPAETRKIYKSLKTTRPRGVGSPQTYWVQSAKLLNLVDTDDGIRFAGAGENGGAEASA